MSPPLSTEAEEKRLRGIARDLRRALLRAIHEAQTGHAGSSLSLVEILVSLYFRHLRIDPARPHWEDRDWCLLSKGHGSPALYAALALRGYFGVERLSELRRFGSGLEGHPVAGKLPGVDVSTGSLGQGLSIAAGLAAGFKLQGRSNGVFCIVGDGELQEGQNWEAMNAAAAFRLMNLCCIVDRNRLQNDGPTEEIMPLGDLPARFRAFGWEAIEVDGHDLAELDEALLWARGGAGPRAIVALTVKGRGVSFMEGVVKWHHHPIDPSQLQAALAEIESPER